jgi:hypothetical protein
MKHEIENAIKAIRKFVAANPSNDARNAGYAYGQLERLVLVALSRPNRSTPEK